MALNYFDAEELVYNLDSDMEASSDEGEYLEKKYHRFHFTFIFTV